MNFTPEILEIARRVVWFQPPEETLYDKIQFLCYLMQYGSIEDICTTQIYYTTDDFQEVLENAYPGIMDKRSWAYWNLVIFGTPDKPMPKRRLE